MNYNDIFKDRLKVYNKLKDNQRLIRAYKLHYKTNHVDCINDWGVTFDPRNDGIIKPKLMPFILWKRQEELVEWLYWMRINKLRGVIDKARGVGATWVAGADAACSWLFEEGYTCGFGSRKADLVDKKGDQGAIIPKIRTFVDHMPIFFRPKGYSSETHAFYMRMLNPENGALIKGESGSGFGRGDRTSQYFWDESAFGENEIANEASLSETTDCQIDISTHNGTDTLFYNKCESYRSELVFVMEWYHNETRNQDWYNKKKAEKENLGLLHVFAQEVDRDAGATLENVVIPKIWVDAAIDAHLNLSQLNWTGNKFSGLDVADGGSDLNAQVIRKGFIIEFVEEWADSLEDTAITTRKAIKNCELYDCNNLNYDAIGVGSGVKATAGELDRAGELKIAFNPFKGSERIDEPEAKISKIRNEKLKNKDLYKNLKSQYWWKLRLAFLNTYKAMNNLDYDKENMISLSSKIPKIADVKRQLSQAQFEYDTKGLIQIKKKGEGKKSPNIADALVISWRVSKTFRNFTTSSKLNKPKFK